MRRPILVAAALALAACSPDFDPASKIEKLRVVALRAEPPEIDPAGVRTAELTSLVLRPDYATTTVPTTVVHLACVPVPGSPDQTPCEMLQNLADPAAIVAAGARQACAAGVLASPWPVIALAGFEVCAGAACGPATAAGTPLEPARVALPAAFQFTAPPGADPSWADRVAVQRIAGVQAVDLAFAIEATPDELVAGAGTLCRPADVADNLARLWSDPGRERVLSVKRVMIRGPESPNPANRNPAVDGIAAGATILDPAAVTTLGRGKLELTPLQPAGAAGEPEPYVKLDARGVAVEPATEEWVYSWFSTAGELENLHTRSVTKPDEWTVWDAGPARVVVVVRDLRGGTSWAVRDVVFAP